ncbi:MAG: cytochrome P450 [Alphaproteobacteria bacterium]
MLGFLRLLLPAGAETTYRLTGSLIFALLSNPEVLEEARADRTVLSLALEETLRWESAVQYVSRETTVDTEISGIPVPAGALLMLGIGSANRDETRFDDPDTFRPRREDVSAHLAFGFGEHFCLGSNLARMEATTALMALLDRLPNLRFEPGAESTMVGMAFRSPDRLPVLFDPRR